MPALFPPSANGIFRGALLGGFVLVTGVPFGLMTWVRTPQARGQYEALEQPVKFDHRHHVNDDGIDCRYCHDGAERLRFAGVPPTSVCMGCHAQIWTRSPLLEEVRSSAFDGRPIEWARVHRLPGFVYFDHSAHVVTGRVECAECHGRVDRMGAVFQQAPLTMGWCLECHRARDRADRRLTHCSVCHR